MRTVLLLITISLNVPAQVKLPKIWDDSALEDWATPIAALGIRPSHLTSAEYYAVTGDNLRTYPIYRPDREPPGYWEWLQKQKPEPLVDAAGIITPADWRKAGEIAFRTMDEPLLRTNDPERIRAARDAKSFTGSWTQSDGSLLFYRWVVTSRGVELGLTACGTCHARVRADGSVLWGASKAPPGVRTFPFITAPQPGASTFPGEPRAAWFWRQITVPWSPDPRLERLREATDEERRAFLRGADLPESGVFLRTHGSPFYATKTPDLNALRYSRYLDATGTHRLRGPEDVARYVAFIAGADPMEFGPHKILSAEQRQLRFRYADEVLYALAVYLLSLEPPKNPDRTGEQPVARGAAVFQRAGCHRCHAPPSYTTGKLTLALDYAPPGDHPNKADIMNVSVGTDPGLAMKTRKGTGFYKIPSLRGVWYRPLFLHDGSVASLEEMFDPARLKPDHMPGGWKGPGVTKRAILGHPFGLNLNAEDKAALLAFLRSL